MSAELIVAALLNVSGVTAVVGTRRALAQLPQNTTFPALVYQVVSTTPLMTINASGGPQRLQSRMQVTALAMSPAGVDEIHAAVMAALNLKSGTYAGQQVISVVRDIKTQVTKDNEAGLWLGSQDFIAHWYE